MGWKAKWAKDSLKAFLPFQPLLRAAKRKLQPYESNPANDDYAFLQGLQMIQLLREAGADLRGASLLEVGSGWKPIVPLLFSAAGCRPIILTDQEVLMDRQTFAATAAYLGSRACEIAEALGVEAEVIEAHFSRPIPDSLSGACEAYHVHYMAPYDMDQIPSGSVDIIESRAVFEHISEKLLNQLLADCRRILSPSGMMCHCIDNSDHWEHQDKSIGRINFLQYPDEAVTILGLNPQNFQNRLRHYEYRGIFESLGFHVVRESSEVDESALRDARTMKLCARYRDVAPEELAILSSYFAVRRSPVLQS